LKNKVKNMDTIIFDNFVKVTVTQEPTEPTVGDTVKFTAIPNLVFPDDTRSNGIYYSFDYTWAVSSDGGQTYIKTGDNSDTLIVPNINDLFSNQTYKVKIILRDNDDSILTENGDFLLTQMGEIIIRNNNLLPLSVQTEESPNNSNTSQDIVSNSIITDKSLGFINLEKVIDQSISFDTTIDDELKTEILSGQSKSLDSLDTTNISSPIQETITLITDTSSVQTPTQQQSIQILNNCAVLAPHAETVGNSTIRWNLCEEIPDSWLGTQCTGYNVYDSLSDCLSRGVPCDNGSGKTTTITIDTGTIPNYLDASGVPICCPGGYELVCAGGLKNLCAGDNICSDLQFELPVAGLTKVTGTPNGNICPCTGRREPAPAIVQGPPTVTNGVVSVACLVLGIPLLLTGAASPVGAGLIALGTGTALGTFGGALAVGSILNGNANVGFFDGLGGQTVTFYKCFNRYYKHIFKCSSSGQLITKDGAYQAVNPTDPQSGPFGFDIPPTPPTPNVSVPQYSCNNGGSLVLEQVQNSTTCEYEYKLTGRKGYTYYCTRNGMNNSAPPSFTHTIPLENNNACDDIISVNNSGPIGCIETGKCQSSCDGQLCCPPKYNWRWSNDLTVVSCNQDLEVSSSSGYTAQISKCNDYSTNTYNVNIATLSQEECTNNNCKSYEDAYSELRNAVQNDYTIVFIETIVKLDLEGYVDKAARAAQLGGIFSRTVICGKNLIKSYKTKLDRIEKINKDKKCETCPYWYKISSRSVMQYPCNDENTQVCGQEHPGNCNRSDSSRTTPIKIRKIQEIRNYSSSDLTRMKADPANYFDGLGKALEKARNEIGRRGMICPDQ